MGRVIDATDGGPATAARLRNPSRVAVDGAGNLYIADTSNHRIRKVDTGGIITTVAGSGATGFAGDGGPAVNASLASPGGIAVDAAGNLYIADDRNNRVRKVDTSGTITTIAGNGTYGFGGDGGQAVDAMLTGAKSVAIDAAGNLYIANGALRKVAPDGSISTLGELKDSAYDVEVAPDGRIYVAVLDGRVYKRVVMTLPASR